MRHEKNAQIRNQMVCDYQEYVLNLGKHLMRTMDLPVGIFDDLVAAGYLGLVEAAERFDASQGIKFRTFAFHRIRGAMIDSIRRCSDFSGRAYRVAKALDAYQYLKEEQKFTKNVAGKKDKKRKLQEIFDFAASGALAYRLSFSDGESKRATQLVDQGYAEKRLIEHEEGNELSKHIEALPEKERIIVEEYYFNGLSFAEITQKYPQLSNKSWVSKLHKRAILQLRNARLAQHAVY